MAEGMRAYDLAKFMHDTYERLAPEFKYITRKESAVPWDRVPANNRRLMIEVAAEVIRKLEAEK